MGFNTLNKLLRKEAKNYPFSDTVFENVDLKVTASIVSIPKEFFAVKRLIFYGIMDGNVREWTKFIGANALSNGIHIRYRGKRMSPSTPIKNNFDFKKYGYDVEIDVDGAATKKVTLSTRISFFKMNRNSEGLRVDAENRKLEFEILDDLSSIADEFGVMVQGWKI